MKLSRRSFLAATAAGVAGYQRHGLTAASMDPITKVHVIFKTHLDIGFTDLAARVIAAF